MSPLCEDMKKEPIISYTNFHSSIIVICYVKKQGEYSDTKDNTEMSWPNCVEIILLLHIILCLLS